MSVHRLFDHGKLLCSGQVSDGIDQVQAPTTEDLGSVIQSVRASQTTLKEVAIDDLIGWLNAAIQPWQQRGNPLQQELGPLGLNYFLYWLKRDHLTQLCDLAMRGDRRVMDSFIPLNSGADLLHHAQPRGLIVHWLAGNVPLLGLLSIIQGLLTKNANIVKVPSQFGMAVPLVLEGLAQASYRTPSGQTLDGRQIMQSTAAIYVDHADQPAQEELSRAADARVAWGSKEAMEAILPLPHAFSTENIVFGPRYSYIVIGREFLQDPTKSSKLAQRVAYDASLFDQYACSSPHTVFLEEGGAVSPQAFAQTLAQEMQATLRRIPRRPVSAAEATAISTVRAEYELLGKVFAPKTLEWTVILAPQLEGLAPPCHGRVLFVRPLPDVLAAAEFASKVTQSVGVALAKERLLAFAKRATARGADRCPAIGQMGFYDLPWDGTFVMDRMVRWVTATSKP